MIFYSTNLSKMLIIVMEILNSSKNLIIESNQNFK